MLVVDKKYAIKNWTKQLHSSDETSVFCASTYQTR
ncbi:hypothetical protein T01_16029 [Trichinella spiralis]|uniref:Uncharacterized protein n=1 Tax=Trichinella spiralis TaxID=6334 RepID=A0A0V0ZFQ2_TRISP|nr:hypothetical protein T01_16029 [Trichinella spiralis]